MMTAKKGMTLMEIIVVLMIIGIATAFFLPNFTTPSEHARSATVENNLSAIYTAQQNYNNNYNTYCLATSSAQSACTATSTHCADTLAAINCNLSLNMQDDGTYTYACAVAGSASTCTATRTNPAAAVKISVKLNSSIKVGTNPTCTPLSSTYNNWCP